MWNNKMDARQDYLAGITGGTLLSAIPSIIAQQLLETILCATVGTIVSFLVSKAMRKLFRAKQNSHR